MAHDHRHDHSGQQDQTDQSTRTYEPDFDARAATWDDPVKVARARQVADAIVGAVSPSTATTVFEYGAGTGLVTEALGERVGAAVLADTSAGMREVMASKVTDGRLRDDTRIVDVDLDAEEVELPTERFGLLVTVLTMHHVADLDRVLRRFAGMATPGGHLCVVDLDAEDGSFHGDGFTGHHGFERDDLVRRLVAAGLDEVTVSDCGVLERDEGTYPMFLAVARSSQARTGGAGS